LNALLLYALNFYVFCEMKKISLTSHCILAYLQYQHSSIHVHLKIISSFELSYLLSSSMTSNGGCNTWYCGLQNTRWSFHLQM